MKSYLSKDLYSNYQIPTRTGLDLHGKIFIKMLYINAKTIWLLEMLLIDICAHWKCRWIMTAFNLTIFYYLTTSCNIIFFKYLSLHCFFFVAFDRFSKSFIFKKDWFSFKRNKLLCPSLRFWLSRKTY